MNVQRSLFLAILAAVPFAFWFPGNGSGREASPALEGEVDAAPLSSPASTGIPYTLQIDAPDARELIAPFEGISLLVRLKGEPPDSMVGLERRLREDLDAARRVLQSYGYYDGTADGTVGQGSPVPVRIVMTPGARYVIGSSTIRLIEGADTSFTKIPRTLTDVDLAEGSPAVAGDVLDAVVRVRDRFRQNGYPFAKIADTRYIVHHDTRVLVAEIAVDPGPPVRMGNVRIEGDSPVHPSFIEAMQTWEDGQPWDQRLADRYRLALNRRGLFRSVSVTPDTHAEEANRRAVVVDVSPAPPRTIGGSVRFDSDFGFGVQGNWMHRNLTGAGDRLRLEMPLWRDSQTLTADYRLPFYRRNDQDLISQVRIGNEKLDAFEQRSVSASLGLERRLSDRWWASASVSAETGQLKDPDEPRHNYYLAGIPAVLRYDSTDSLLDATRGVRASLAMTPYVGSYDETFSVLRSRLDASTFWSVTENDTFVLALRGAVGSMIGASADVVPASVRFYSGGGGSVRGYEFQSIGPRNSRKQPLGGAAFEEVSLEGRLRWNETWGGVVFVDGGAVHNDDKPRPGQDMQWGAGVGVRMYTAIGPVRFDIATPLNPRPGDGSFQVYISIGQSF